MKKQTKLIYYLFIMLIYSSYQSSDVCSDLDNDKCDQYTPPEGDDGTKQCLPVGENGKCALKSCEELSSSDLTNNCDYFHFEDEEYQCVEKRNGDGWEKKKCTELEGDRCDAFKNEGVHAWIQNENGDGCEYKTCEQLKPEQCSQYELYDEQNRRCYETDDRKDCE